MENEIRKIYKDDFAEYLLCLALDVGEGLLKNGAEIRRVEDTIERICMAYGAEHVEVFSIISFINAAVRMPDGSYSSQLRRVKSTSNDIETLEYFNALSREICRDKPSLDEFDRRITSIKERKKYPNWMLIAASTVSVGAFAVFFGGGIVDAFISALIGSLISVIDIYSSKRLNLMAKMVISSFVATFIATLAVKIGIVESNEYSIIGSIMLLVPGLAFGSALRDLLYGDLLAGTLKTLQACLSSLMIAFGYMIGVSLLGSVSISSPMPPVITEDFFTVNLLVRSVSIFIASVTFSVICKIGKRHLLIGGILATLTFLIFYTAEFFNADPFIAAFISTAIAALCSEILARVRRAPTLVFSLAAVIPTVPGGGLYYTMRYLLENNAGEASKYFESTLMTGLGIAGGIVSVSIIFALISDSITKLKNK